MILRCSCAVSLERDGAKLLPERLFPVQVGLLVDRVLDLGEELGGSVGAGGFENSSRRRQHRIAYFESTAFLLADETVTVLSFQVLQCTLQRAVDQLVSELARKVSAAGVKELGREPEARGFVRCVRVAAREYVVVDEMNADIFQEMDILRKLEVPIVRIISDIHGVAGNDCGNVISDVGFFNLRRYFPPPKNSEGEPSLFIFWHLSRRGVLFGFISTKGVSQVVFDPEFDWFDPKRIDKSTSLFSVHQRKVHVNSAARVYIAKVMVTITLFTPFPRNRPRMEPHIDGT